MYNTYIHIYIHTDTQYHMSGHGSIVLYYLSIVVKGRQRSVTFLKRGLETREVVLCTYYQPCIILIKHFINYYLLYPYIVWLSLHFWHI